MATAPGNPHHSVVSEPERSKSALSDKDRADLRSDRIQSILIMLVIIALFALVAWLASIAPVSEDMEYHYWMMP